jgi:hypothetical protein
MWGLYIRQASILSLFLKKLWYKRLSHLQLLLGTYLVDLLTLLLKLQAKDWDIILFQGNSL